VEQAPEAAEFHPVQIRVPADVFRLLEEVSAAECRTVSAQVLYFVKKGLGLQTRTRGKPT
jgi:hypothetical protein